MATRALRRLSAGITPVITLFFLLLVSLYLMSSATQNSAQFGQLYSFLLVLNILELVVLVGLIAVNLQRLRRQYREGVVGSRLTVRLVTIFVILSVVPVSLVYYFSVDFLQRGIDSWFDVRTEKALTDALELSRIALDGRMRDLLRQTELMARDLEGISPGEASARMDALRYRSGASDLTLMTLHGEVIVFTSDDPTLIVPLQPSEPILLGLRQGLTHVGLDPIRDTGLYVRVIVNVPSHTLNGAPRALQALFPIASNMNTLAEGVQTAYAKYQELGYLREPLKFSFTLTLSLVLLLSLLMAVWAALFSARRLTEPVRVLAIGTRAVAAGNYDQQLPSLPAHDELSFLVTSFNDMTKKIALARDEAQASHQHAEQQRAYLEAVLVRLSSGVLTFDAQQVLRTANLAANQILGHDITPHIGKTLRQIRDDHPPLRAFVEALLPHLSGAPQEWREEIALFGSGGRKILMCRGAPLPHIENGRTDAVQYGQPINENTDSGYVTVFDDITALIQAQRDAAWGEVARRLAHEIKNPLTPIQLSAERLRYKYLDTIVTYTGNEEDAHVLDRATHTIIQQVAAMKEMVKAFSDYARAPKLVLQPLDLNMLIEDVVDLYRGHDSKIRLLTELDKQLPTIEADAGRFRQLLHNLFKNSLDALHENAGCCIIVTTRWVHDSGSSSIELTVSDNGPGIPSEILGTLFEPGVTRKSKGSGLGLAIVKKIVEEHGGVVKAGNNPEGGACVSVRLPRPHNPGAATVPAPGQEGDGLRSGST
jgi:nitrogen fixation/metabolism regulation signal transduction histidine kinase